MYNILPYSYKEAKKLNVKIKPSKRKNKKIDVYNKSNNYLLSIGDINYKDYPTFKNENGKQFADKRRELYLNRHKKDKDVIGSKGYYASKILW